MSGDNLATVLVVPLWLLSAGGFWFWVAAHAAVGNLR